MKRFLLATMCFAAICSYAQTEKTDVFRHFERRIHPREVKTAEQTERDRLMSRGERELRKMMAEAEAKADTAAARFTGWRGVDVIKLNKAAKDGAKKEKLDSIVRKDITGKLVSKQVFTYTDEGWQRHCDNYVPDEATGEWSMFGYYDYEYDDLGRTITMTNFDATDATQCAKYEFYYTDDSPYYTSQIYNTYENGEWTPAQRADYVYDKMYNTTEETYSLFSVDDADWTPVERKTATYDDGGRVTSYYEWVWDAAAGDWIGRPNSLLSQTFIYDEDGRDKQTSYYKWENGAWVEYQRIINTYDDKGNLVVVSTNSLGQDGLTWNENGKQEYAYDDHDNRTLMAHYAKNSAGEWVCDLKITSEYEYLEDGTYNVATIQYKPLRVAGQLDPYSKTEQTITKYNSEIYYKISRINSDYTDFVPAEETERYVDEYDNYFGSTSYGFMANEDGSVTRYGTLREYFTFADDWEPSSRLNNPVTYRIQHGSPTSDTEFTDYQMYEYSWADGTDAMSGYNNYQFVNGNKTPIATWVTDFDQSVAAEDLYAWPIATQIEAMTLYKVLATHNYRNWDYLTGDSEWDEDDSYNDAYYYSVW